ncbi:MAG: alpha/beta fold hydrolase [Terriglobales bacterium]
MERQEGFVSVDGHRMRYVRAGVGPPLLLLHGLLGYSFSWRLNEASLARHSTFYAVDLLGVGGSDRPRGLDNGLHAQARRMLRVMEELGLESADVLGTSHGGALALMMAALAVREGRPRVKSLILAAPANRWSKHGRIFSRVLGNPPLRWMLPAPMRWLTPLFGGLFVARQYGDRKRISPGTVEGYSRPMLAPGGFEYGLDILRTLRRDLQETAGLLPHIAHLPVLLVWGMRDHIVLPESLAPLRACFRQAELVLIEGAGHVPYEEFPEEFNRAVGTFLAGTSRVG